MNTMFILFPVISFAFLMTGLWIVCHYISKFKRVSKDDLSGDVFDGDPLGASGYAVDALNIGDVFTVRHNNRPLSDLDGDPLDDENYVDVGDYDDDDDMSGGIFDRLKEKRARKKAAKNNAPAVELIPTPNASNVSKKQLAKIAKKQKKQINMVDSAPGARLSQNTMLPFLSVNGAVDAPPTAVGMEGQDFFAALTRYQTTYPGSSVQKSATSTGATITFTWAHTDFTGAVGATPVIILSHAASTINAAAGAKYTIGVSAYDETGKALTIPTWAYRRKLANDRVLVYLIPYVEVASKLYPVIIKVVSGATCVLTLSGVPVDETVTSIFPGTNHADFIAFKELLKVR